jgi:hypothetical protein
MFDEYEIKLEEPQIIPAQDNCFLIADKIIINPLSLFVRYQGKMYELDNGELIEKIGRTEMQVTGKINCIYDVEE